MKILDEKGKLFGKLNIIDLLAILVLVAALAFGGYKLATRGSSGGGTAAEGTSLTYTTRVLNVTGDTYAEVLRQLELAGGKDQLMANGSMIPNSYITGVEAVPHVNYLTDDQGQVTISRDSGPDARYDLLFTIQAQASDPVTSLVGTQEVRVGKSHIVKSVHLEFTGTVVTCDWA